MDRLSWWKTCWWLIQMEFCKLVHLCLTSYLFLFRCPHSVMCNHWYSLYACFLGVYSALFHDLYDGNTGIPDVEPFCQHAEMLRQYAHTKHGEHLGVLARCGVQLYFHLSPRSWSLWRSHRHSHSRFYWSYNFVMVCHGAQLHALACWTRRTLPICFHLSS